MSWVTTTLWWYAIILALGLVFFPLTKRIFGRFFYDLGYPFAKTLGILILSYSAFTLSTFNVIPFLRESLLLLIVAFLLLSVWKFRHIKIKKAAIPLIVVEEMIFLIALFFWTYIRGQEPSIRGLEKFMDFGFMSSILKSTQFPPLDMWYAGGTVNYYYFGHLTGSVLTKLTSIAPTQAYNLFLSTIFALSITQTFSLTFNLIYIALGKNFRRSIAGGILGSFLVNFAGNLHTIYLFTKGYENERPIPFWEILSSYNPQKYWYPNATRFIPFTIHEFPIYSYVVADLHGHVFDIPFVLLTFAILFITFLTITKKGSNVKLKKLRPSFKYFNNKYHIVPAIALGALSAIHYMTNAFDGFIYILLAGLVFFTIYKLSLRLFVIMSAILSSFLIFSLPFSLNFTPFASGIGVNCAPDALVNMKRLGPFLFEQGNCQSTPPWMLIVLWGFFWLNFVFFVVYLRKKGKHAKYDIQSTTNRFILIFFGLSTTLVLIPELFYIKDIYPAHFRANTMFKLGYQAFMMMGIASAYVFVLIKSEFKNEKLIRRLYLALFAVAFFLVAIYPFFAITSYYGNIDRKPNLDGAQWILTKYPEYKEIIDYINSNVAGQPTILEAQGDSYTDYNVVSSYTGLPTVAGWQVHEWLWRGSADIVGKRIPDIQAVYEGDNMNVTTEVIKKYQVQYIIVGSNEREKYKNLNEQKIARIGKQVFVSSEGNGKIFSVEHLY